MIQGWEEEFHCKLLTRSRKGVRFTREGELFVTLCQQVLALEKTFREDVSSAADELTGSITIGVSLNYMSRHFPTILRRFTQTYPRVHLTVIDSHSEKLYSDLLNHKLDIAIVRGDYKWFDTKILLDSEPFCLVSCHPLTEETLCQEPYVGHRTDMTPSSALTAGSLKKNSPFLTPLYGLAVSMPAAMSSKKVLAGPSCPRFVSRSSKETWHP